MKLKVGTTMDEQLYRQLQERSFREGVSISHLIESAVRSYFAHRTEAAVDRVSETFALYRVSKDVLRQVMDEDLYES
jgi:metal-responsive CopG/Arc/MetJ family transcriptional regulator